MRPPVAPATPLERRRIVIRGLVQGTGFRPFVYGVAVRLGLAGWVRNQTRGVTIEVEGAREALDRMIEALRNEAPPLARIDHLEWSSASLAGETTFRIEASEADDSGAIAIGPDTATCDECLAELLDPADRRHGYPFLNCTRCGPRLTIVLGVPYDRARTTMASFPLCPECRAEYENPLDRRFHAQPTACPVCGPRLEWRPPPPPASSSEAVPPLESAARAIERGEVVAIKGLGGYHLACDAASDAAVATLRERKHREARPFALMAQDVAAARALCETGELGERLLTSRERPIVLMTRRPGAAVADGVAPGTRLLGVMLPYTPLHTLLMARLGRPIVLTSGNRSDEPIQFRDDEAAETLGPIADGMLVHDRPIAWRCDDGVVRASGARPITIRRARGHAPRAIAIAPAAPRPIAALGGHQKNTFCLLRDDRATLSQHLGDLDTPAARAGLGETLAHYERVFAFRPEAIACDLHPDYASSRLARELAEARGLPLIAVQHHHAHAAAVLAEHRVAGPALGVILDGAGLGDDGTVWGFEFLEVDGDRMTRLGHVEHVPLAGGDAASRDLRRVALAWLDAAFDGAPPDLPVVRGLDPAFRAAVTRMLRTGTRAPACSSAGRWFDAVAAIAGVRERAQYEGQAAMELEGLARGVAVEPYPVELAARDGAPFVVRGAPAIRAIAEDALAGAGREAIADGFHRTVIEAIRLGAAHARATRGLARVALGGGCFQNALLLDGAADALARDGFEVLHAIEAPPNDGGLALGQAAVAAARLARERS